MHVWPTSCIANLTGWLRENHTKPLFRQPSSGWLTMCRKQHCQIIMSCCKTYVLSQRKVHPSYIQ